MLPRPLSGSEEGGVCPHCPREWGPAPGSIMAGCPHPGRGRAGLAERGGCGERCVCRCVRVCVGVCTCVQVSSAQPRVLWAGGPAQPGSPLAPLWPRIPFLLVALGAHPCPQGSLGSETAESGGREFSVTALSPGSWMQPLLGPLPEGHRLLRSGASWGPQWRCPGCTLSSHRPQGRKRPRGRGTARPAGHQPPEFGPSAPLCLQPCLPQAHPTCRQQC